MLAAAACCECRPSRVVEYHCLHPTITPPTTAIMVIITTEMQNMLPRLMDTKQVNITNCGSASNAKKAKDESPCAQQTLMEGGPTVSKLDIDERLTR